MHEASRVNVVERSLDWERLCAEHESAVVVKPLLAGICSADVKEVRGERITRRDFGHELVAEVVASTHEGFAIGTHVVLDPHVELRRETAFAEVGFFAGPSRALSAALHCVGRDEATYVLAEPLACVVHACTALQRCERQRVLIIGAGFFGYLFYRHLECLGHRTYLTNWSAPRLAVLDGMIPGLRIDTFASMPEGSFDVVVMSGLMIEPAHVEYAAAKLRSGGQILLFGAVATAAMELYDVRNQAMVVRATAAGRDIVLAGTLGTTAEAFRAAIDALARPEFAAKIAAIVGDVLDFEQGCVRLNELARDRRSYTKTLIDLRAPKRAERGTAQ